MRNLETDSLLAIVGLLPTAITASHRAQARTIPEAFERRALAWWRRDKRSKFKVINAGNLDKLFDKIAAPPDSSELTKWLKAAGDDTDLIEDLFIALGEARAYLVKAWPRIQIRSFAGTRLARLAVDDSAEVASLWAVLNDPLNLLDEMDSGTLSPTQATAFRKAYPYLYDFYRDALFDGAAARVKDDKEWLPTEAQEIALAVLTGQPAGALPDDAEETQAEKPKPEEDLGAARTRTQADQSSKPVGVK